MIYFTSDLHLMHDKEFLYKPRGYSNVEEMCEFVISNINNRVKEDDTLYILGDLMLNDLEKATEYLKKIKCKNIYAILGNHDSDERRKIYEKLGIKCSYAEVVKYGKYTFILTHWPMRVGNFDDKKKKPKFYNLCGHTHTSNKWTDFISMRAYHVELNAQNNLPVSVEKVINDIENYRIPLFYRLFKNFVK